VLAEILHKKKFTYYKILYAGCTTGNFLEKKYPFVNEYDHWGAT
jgi:hypothetical protein